MPPASSSAVHVNRTSRRRPGDRVARRIEAGRARLGREQPHDAELHRDHRLHVDRAAAVDVAVDEVGRERVVGPALGRGRDDVEMREQQERLAAGAVAAQPGVDRATSRAPARRSRVRGRLRRACVAMWRAATQLAVGRLGRRRVDRRDPDQRRGPSRPARRARSPRRRRRPAATAPRRPSVTARSRSRRASAMPITKPPNISASDHRQQQLAVVALLAEAGLRVGIAAAGDVRRLRGPSPARSGRAASRTRPDRAAALAGSVRPAARRSSLIGP